MIDNVSYVDKQFAPLPIQTDATELQRDAIQKQAAWFQELASNEKKLVFAAALRRWGLAAGKQDVVEHAERLLAGEI